MGEEGRKIGSACRAWVQRKGVWFLILQATKSLKGFFNRRMNTIGFAVEHSRLLYGQDGSEGTKAETEMTVQLFRQDMLG